ncbi:MAG: hypothetical protein K6A80_08730, partial [Saccharofermentans sp.]|nr:hypothetical protein [Saccharofermentans sp.]
LIEISHFNSFIELLNEQIKSRGLLAKIGTKCNILLDSIGEAVANTGSEFDKNMMTTLNRAARPIRHYKKEMKYELERLELDLRGDILEIGNELIDKLGVSAISDEDQKATNKKIEQKSEEYIEKIEKSLSTRMSELDGEIEDVLASDIGLYVFQDIHADSYKANSVYTQDYSAFVEKYGSASKMLKVGGEKVANMALVDGATSFSKLAASSGSTIHKAVLNVGHFFGTKFKPWQAVKIANGVGKVAKAAGPVLAVVDVAVTIGSKVMEEKKRKEVQDAKDGAFNSISGIASDIITEIDKQYALMEAEAFDQKTEEIDAIKSKMVQQAGDNSEFVKRMREYGDQTKALLESINGIE